MGETMRVIADHEASSSDPIQVKEGEEVMIDHEKKTNISGWVWCTNSAGKSGWVPVAYLEQRGTQGIMKCEYNAVELTVRVGDLLTVYKMESGFYWARSSRCQQGWIPVENVAPVQFG